MLRAPVLPLLLASFAAGCSSTSNGVAGIELRGAAALYGASEITGASRGYGQYDTPSHGGGFGIAGNLRSAMRSYGLRASINTPVIDVIGGADEHRVEGQQVTEANLGLRKRVPATDSGAVYVEAEFRRGFGLESLSGRRDYDGLECGTGVIVQLSEHWFLDVGFSVEWTTNRLDLPSGHDRSSDFLFDLGFGFSF